MDFSLRWDDQAVATKALGMTRRSAVKRATFVAGPGPEPGLSFVPTIPESGGCRARAFQVLSKPPSGKRLPPEVPAAVGHLESSLFALC
jgi:hypothetical protein